MSMTDTDIVHVYFMAPKLLSESDIDIDRHALFQKEKDRLGIMVYSRALESLILMKLDTDRHQNNKIGLKADPDE